MIHKWDTPPQWCLAKVMIPVTGKRNTGNYDDISLYRPLKFISQCFLEMFYIKKQCSIYMYELSNQIKWIKGTWTVEIFKVKSWSETNCLCGYTNTTALQYNHFTVIDLQPSLPFSEKKKIFWSLHFILRWKDSQK